MTILYFILFVLAIAAVIQCIVEPAARELWLAYVQQVGIGFDQFVNSLIPPFGALSYADETLSARTYRAWRDGRLIGIWLMPVIDFMFRWQGFQNHCQRAYWKEIDRRSLPPEYRDAKSGLKE